MRRKLRRPIEKYIRTPKCLCCGGPLTRDKAQEKHNKKNTCWCDGAPHPHRKGSLPLCPGYKHDDDDWMSYVALMQGSMCGTPLIQNPL